MAKLSYYLDSRRPLSDGSCPIKLRITLKDKGKFLISSGISACEDQWLGNRLISGRDRNNKNNILAFRYNKVQDYILELESSGKLQRIENDQLKAQLNNVFFDIQISEANESTNFLKYYKSFIANKTKRNTIGKYNYTINKIRFFYNIEELSFSDINLSWLRGFELRLKNDNISINTIATHMQNIKAIFNAAINDDIIEQNTYPFRKFKIKHEQTAKRSLTLEQLRLLRDWKVDPHQEKYRDIFMLSFYLIGVNMIDLLNIKKISDGRIEYRRAKTNKLYSIAVPPEAMEIIDKYKGVDYLLDIMDRYKDQRDFAKRLTKNLREIGSYEMVMNAAKSDRYKKKNKKMRNPFFPDISMYWARHTWATMAAELNIPDETISQALGHSDGNRVTNIYINRNSNKVDEANRRVIDYIK